MIREIEQAKPKYMVFVNVQASWLVRRNSERLIFKWFNNYAERNYEMVGIVDIDAGGTNYLWDKDVKGYLIKSNAWLSVFRRRG